MSDDLLHIDIEAYSDVDLRKFGVYAYAESPEFEILMAGWYREGSEEGTRVAVGREEIEQIPGLFDHKVTKVAHNAQFERVCFSAFLGMSPGDYLPPEEWIDTAALAAAHGLPRKLESLAKALQVAEKDTAGTRLINLFCKPKKDGTRVMPEDKPEQWAEFVEYCRQDVDTLVEVHSKVHSWTHPFEQRVFHADQRINDRGIFADLDLARVAVEVDDANYEVAEAEMRGLLGIDNAGSVQQITKALAERGLEMADLRADTITATLADPDTPATLRRALELRQQTALVASKKYRSALGSATSDQRIRGGFVFFGAHTGRWSGRGVQLQNLPKAQVKHTEAAILDLHLGLGADAETLKGLVRALFFGPFTVVDYSAIEARVLAWAAGEQWAIGAFSEGRDIYVETAERMGGLTRQQGKIAVLALGYQGGIGSLRSMGAEGDDGELQFLVHQYRKANPRIVRMWKRMESAFMEGGQVGRVKVEKSGRTRRIVLPSGRPIVYHGVSKTATRGITFTDPKGGRADTYGGRLTENVVQAISRDILANALVALEEGGYPVVGHVHDEVVVEGEYSVEDIAKIMCDLPAWAHGLPLAAEGFQCQRYRKG